MMHVLALTALSLVAATDADVDASYQAALTHAQAHELDAAIHDYELLLSQGRDGPALRYNLGTLCLDKGDLGCAMFHLRVAERLAPDDDDVAHNLMVAREQRVDRVGDDGASDLGMRLPPRATRVAAALGLALLGVACVLHTWRRRRVTAWVLAGASMLVVVTGGACAMRMRAEQLREATVIDAETTTRKTADAAGDVGFTAHAGLSGRVVDETGAFVQLRLDNGVESWFERKALRIYPDTDARR